MTMLFRTYGAALRTILGNNQGSDFITVGYGARQKDALEYLNSSRTVEVVYISGEFPKSSSSRAGGQNHQMQYVLSLTVSKAAEGDLATLNNESATAQQLTTAISNLKLAEHAADESLDELADIVYQIAMSAVNMDLGLSVKVANTWISDFKKEKPSRIGDLVVIRGQYIFGCQGTEEITGVNPVTGVGIDISMDFPGDDVQEWEISTTP